MNTQMGYRALLALGVAVAMLLGIGVMVKQDLVEDAYAQLATGMILGGGVGAAGGSAIAAGKAKTETK